LEDSHDISASGSNLDLHAEGSIRPILDAELDCPPGILGKG
jgi:hypothetical protein